MNIIFISPQGRYTRRAKAHLSWQPYYRATGEKQTKKPVRKNYATNI